MSMNHIIIYQISDLQAIIEKPFVFTQTNDTTNHYFPNMWAISLIEHSINTILLKDLSSFFDTFFNYTKQKGRSPIKFVRVLFYTEISQFI